MGLECCCDYKHSSWTVVILLAECQQLRTADGKMSDLLLGSHVEKRGSLLHVIVFFFCVQHTQLSLCLQENATSQFQATFMRQKCTQLGTWCQFTQGRSLHIPKFLLSFVLWTVSTLKSPIFYINPTSGTIGVLEVSMHAVMSSTS